MKRHFTPESLEMLLEEIRIRNILKRVNYGRSYPLTMPGGGNPYAAAIENLGAPIDAFLIVDGKQVPVQIVASTIRDKVRPAAESIDNGDAAFSLSGSLAASGSRKQRRRPIEEFELKVDVPGYRILDSKVSENGMESLGVFEDGTCVFRDSDTNQCVANDTSNAELRGFRDGESSLLPSVHGAEVQDTPVKTCGSDTDSELIDRIRAGSAEAFADLVAKYGRIIMGNIRRSASNEDAEDIYQNVLIAVAQQLDIFRGKANFRHGYLVYREI